MINTVMITGYLGRFRIAAHDINVLPKHSLVEQKPNADNGNDGDDH